MPQAAISQGLLSETYRLPAQSLEVAGIVYLACRRTQDALIAGAVWYVYNSFVGPPSLR